MNEEGFFPDAAVTLEVENTDVEARLLPGKMEAWKKRRDRKLQWRQRGKDRKQKKRVCSRLSLAASFSKEKESEQMFFHTLHSFPSGSRNCQEEGRTDQGTRRSQGREEG